MHIRKRSGIPLILVLTVSVFTSFSCTSHLDNTPKTELAKGIELITNVEEYSAQVTVNPDMKLLDLEEVIKGISLDIRYATEDNFTGEKIYSQAKAYLRKPVALALKSLSEYLAEKNVGLKVFDAYRPYQATVRFYEVYPNKDFVADPRYGSRHNRGCAVDLTLIDLKTGRNVPMPTEFDEFTEKAYPGCTDLPKELINNRTFLFQVMAKFGFRHYATEWWHFDFEGWEQYPLMDLSFEDLERTVEK